MHDGAGRVRGRWVAVACAGLGALVLAAACARGWDDLRVAWHRWGVARDPARIAEFAAAPAESVRGRALRAYGRSKAGRDALLRAFLAAIDNPDRLSSGVILPELREFAARRGEPADWEWVAYSARGSGLLVTSCVPSSEPGGPVGFSSESWDGPVTFYDGSEPPSEWCPEGFPLAGALASAMGDIGYSDHRLAEWPGVRFFLLSEKDSGRVARLAETGEVDEPCYPCVLVEREPARAAEHLGVDGDPAATR